MGRAILNTVLGLAVTPSTIGWVTAAGSHRPGIGEEVWVDGGDAGPDAVGLAAQASAVAARVGAMLAARGDRLRGVAVTWSDDAAVAAALLLESLADAGFDHVVPVRYGLAAASLAGGLQAAAVCVVEPGLATLVLPARPGAPEPVVDSHAVTDFDQVADWLGDRLAAGGQRPETLMVAGSVRGMDRLGRRLESHLGMPVFVQGGAIQALARGAAQALAPHAELTSTPLGAPAAGLAVGALRRHRPRPLSYVAALLMLAVGTVTLVASLAAALSLQLGPDRSAPESPVPQRATVARVVVPAPAPAAIPALPPAAPAETEDVEFGSLWDASEIGSDLSEPGGVPTQLERVRDHVYGPSGR